MKLTPLDIHHKEFHRAMRGYSEAEVDVFLDQVADEFERLFKENLDYKEKVEKMQEKVKQYEGLEQTLQKALFTAQQAADEVQGKAQEEADLIIKDAEAKAREVIQEAITQKEDLRRDIESLRKAEKEFREKFRELLKSYMGVIDSIEKGELRGEEEESPAAAQGGEPSAEPADIGQAGIQKGAEKGDIPTEKKAEPEPPEAAQASGQGAVPRVTIGEPKPTETGGQEAAPTAGGSPVEEGKTDEFDFFGGTSFFEEGPRDFGLPGQRSTSPGWQPSAAPSADFRPSSPPESQVSTAEASDSAEAARKVSNFFDDDLGSEDEEGKSSGNGASPEPS